MPAPMLLASQPGIARDGTRLTKQTYLDAQWTRFYQDRPRKMLGYREQVRDANGVMRALNVFNNGGFCYVHAGSTAALQRYAIELSSGVNTTLIDRTPAGYVADSNALWQFALVYDSDSATTNLFAVPNPSLNDITSSGSAQIYYGDVNDIAILQPAVNIGMGGGNITTTGGIVGIAGYLFRFGHDGSISWSLPSHPRNTTDTGSGTTYPVADKIVAGAPIRGSNVPTGIFWSLSSVIIGTFVGSPNYFNFTTITTSGSIMSANSMIEHNGIYYWASTSGFSQYSGVVQDIPNEYNQQWFLDNVNMSARQKVFAFKVPRWKEIWWCFPYGQSTECTHAVIYNYEKRYWYDTPLPNNGRAAGQFNVTYSFPIMTGVQTNTDTGGTSIWQHETGLNEVSGAPQVPKAIQSYIETQEFSRLPVDPAAVGDTSSTSYGTIEPDFNQAGPLTVEIYSRANANAPFESPTSDPNYPYTLPAPDGTMFSSDYINDPTEQTQSIKWTGRQTSFVIESNVRDGNFIWGAPLIHITKGDNRKTG
jgi:hypothetical protein